MNPAGYELQMRDIDSKFRHELEKIRNNESGEFTKFQVEIERNLETKFEELAVAFWEHKTTNKNQIGEFKNRLDQAFTEENVEWQSKMSNKLRDDTTHCKGEAEFSAQTTSSKQMGLITAVISIATEVENTQVGLAVEAKDGVGDEQLCLNTATTSRKFNWNKRSEMGLKDTLNSLLIYSTLDDDPVPPTPIVWCVFVFVLFQWKRKLPICW